jgi:hypothetical protein
MTEPLETGNPYVDQVQLAQYPAEEAQFYRTLLNRARKTSDTTELIQGLLDGFHILLRSDPPARESNDVPLVYIMPFDCNRQPRDVQAQLDAGFTTMMRAQ